MSPGQAPIVSRGPGTYDIASRRASVRDIRTSLEQSGETLQITGERVVVVARPDSMRSANDATYYLTRRHRSPPATTPSPTTTSRRGRSSAPGSFVVARPAVLYIGDVPVMWLPFLFQDIRSGRHSGILAPNVGVSDIVRNSPSYRRQRRGARLLLARSATTSTPRRRSTGAARRAQAEIGDSAFMRYNGEFRYRWLDRLRHRQPRARRTRCSGGSRNTARSWGHSAELHAQQLPARRTSNYVTNTQLQRSTTVNPYASLATIRSSGQLPAEARARADFSLGASQQQYPGRTQLDRTFPTLSITTSRLSLGSWLTWTPSLSYTATQATGIDQPSPLGLLLRPGKTRSAGADRSSATRSGATPTTATCRFDTPIDALRLRPRQPVQRHVGAATISPSARSSPTSTPGVEQERIYAQTYRTSRLDAVVHAAAAGAQQLQPDAVAVARERGRLGATAIRNERTGGEWVHQSQAAHLRRCRRRRRCSASSAASGPFTRDPALDLADAVATRTRPQADVSDEYLAAIGRTRVQRERPGRRAISAPSRRTPLSFGLATNLEAKTRSRERLEPGGGRQDQAALAQLHAALATTSSARRYTQLGDPRPHHAELRLHGALRPAARLRHRRGLLAVRGLHAERLGEVRAVPRADHRVVLRSATRANPVRGVHAPLRARRAGRARPSTDRHQRRRPTIATRARSRRSRWRAAPRGTRPSSRRCTKGWQASFTFTSLAAAPADRAPANVIAVRSRGRSCAAVQHAAAAAWQYDQCVAQRARQPEPPTPDHARARSARRSTSSPPTHVARQQPQLQPHRALGGELADAVRLRAARTSPSQIVSLQRDLHDWRAIFAFTQSPNGSFAFNFLDLAQGGAASSSSTTTSARTRAKASSCARRP